jgi:hypothetical protein
MLPLFALVDVENDLQLELNQSFRLDRTLVLGSVTESVEVTASMSQVNYDSPQIAHVVGTEQLENVPELVHALAGLSRRVQSDHHSIFIGIRAYRGRGPAGDLETRHQ